MDVTTSKQEKPTMEENNRWRYMRLHAIVEDINSNPLRRTQDWFDEHHEILSLYKYHFTAFTDLHPEIEGIEFRINCKMLDTLMDKLLKEYDIYRWFSLYDYSRFNQTLISVIDYAFENCEDDISDIFSSLNI